MLNVYTIYIDMWLDNLTLVYKKMWQTKIIIFGVSYSADDALDVKRH